VELSLNRLETIMPPLFTSTTTGWGPQLSTRARVRALARGFPPFLPKEVERIKDRQAIELAKRIERVPVKVRNRCSLFPVF
jgi:hypothetical protein